MRSISRPIVATVAALLVVLVAGVTLVPVASAADNVTFVVKIDGEDVSKSNGSNPIAIDGEVPLEVTIDNGTSKPVTVNAVRLIGRSVGATVFSSEIAIGAQLDPGETQTRTIQLDLRGITDQANGLFEGEVQLLDPDRNVIASARRRVGRQGLDDLAVRPLRDHAARRHDHPHGVLVPRPRDRAVCRRTAGGAA